MSEQFIRHALFNDFDHFANTLRSWDLDFLQIDRGRFYADLLQAGTECVQLSKLSLNRHVIQRGSIPREFRTFGVPHETSSQFIWRNKAITRDCLLVFPPGEGLDAVSFAGFKVYTISVSEKHLNGLAFQAGLPPMNDLLIGTDVIICERSQMDNFRRQLHRICCELQKNYLLGNPWLVHEMESALPNRLLDLLVSSKEQVIPTTSHRRRRTMKRMEEYIEAHSHEPLTVDELCRIAETSERTLRYAFNETLGVSPKRYILTRRLNSVRRELRQFSSDGILIADVANRWGFWHMGKFAADYRNLFGELPSETLCKQ